MPYIGKSPSAGVRQRYQYTATAGQTTFSGTDTGNLTLNYTDNNFVDVFQNGVLLKGGGTDYTATSGTSVVLATGASVSDVIEIIVYDVFSVGNFYSRTDSDSRYALTTGATMSGALDLNGQELILDADADTSITADTDDQIDFKLAGTDRFSIASTGATTITTAGNEDSLTLTSTDADSNAGPNLRFYRNSASPADNDLTGVISFDGRNDNSQDFTLGEIQAYMNDASDGTEDSSITYTVMSGGSAHNAMQFNPTETVFNESSVDRDFRVETDSTANGFVVDGGQNGIGIGVSQKAYSDDSKVTMDFTGFGNGIFMNVNGTSTAYFLEFNNGGGNRGEIATNGSNLTYSTSSDYRLKENVEDMTGAITRLKNLKPKRFSWVTDKKGSADTDGFLAHEVTDVVPDAVVHSKDETKVRKNTVKDASGNILGNMSKDEWEAKKASGDFASDTTYTETETVPVYQSVDYSKLVTLLTGSLQEAIAKIETLEARIKKLEDG